MPIGNKVLGFRVSAGGQDFALAIDI